MLAETSGRLLIVDDQPDSIALLLSYLRSTRLDILVALDGQDAVMKATRGQPDLILLDIAMPGLDGLELCKLLKAEISTSRIPVIFLSARVELDYKLLGFSAGAIDYITKPFAEEEVIARIMVHIHHKQRLDCLESVAGLRVLEAANDHAEPEDALFVTALRVLELRMDDPPGLAELLDQLGVSERKLNQVFRRRVGMTVFDYFTELRLETARHLLESSRLQIQLIASRVGYRNAGDFTRAFRRRYGASPRQYRIALGVSVDENG